MPARNLSDESVHDLADALRGLPDALEALNTRVEQASTSADVEAKLAQTRLELEQSNHAAMVAQDERHRQEMDQLRKEQGDTRRRTVAFIVIALLIGFGAMGYAVRQNARGLSILNGATSPAAQQVGADQIAVVMARFDCNEEKNIQQQTNALASLLGKPTVVVFGSDNCQPALQAALDKLAADQAAAGRKPTDSSSSTIPRPSSGPAGKPGPAGPAGPTGPAPSSTTTTTQPPSTTTTTTPPTPPSTTCTTVASIGICRPSGQANGSEEVPHSRAVRRA